jgi:hypothetical protein
VSLVIKAGLFQRCTQDKYIQFFSGGKSEDDLKVAKEGYDSLKKHN